MFPNTSHVMGLWPNVVKVCVCVFLETHDGLWVAWAKLRQSTYSSGMVHEQLTWSTTWKKRYKIHSKLITYVKTIIKVIIIRGGKKHLTMCCYWEIILDRLVRCGLTWCGKNFFHPSADPFPITEHPEIAVVYSSYNTLQQWFLSFFFQVTIHHNLESIY